MKKIIISFVVTLIITAFSSCSTQTITVSGLPGTTIMTKNYEKKGVIESSGQTQIKINKKPYTHYLLSQAPNSDVYVPFALDYKDQRRAGYHMAIGMVAMYAGLFIVPSSAYLGACISIGGIASWVGAVVDISGHDGADNHFDYLPYQVTNNNLIKFDK